MDAFADKLGMVGAWCSQNKYLNAIKNGFTNYMPATIAGAVAVLWTNVIVNADTGLGKFFSPIMAISPFNAVFNAVNTATIGCIAVGVCMLVGQEIAEANGETGVFPAVLAFMMWVVVTPLSVDVASQTALSYTQADGLSASITVGDVVKAYLAGNPDIASLFGKVDPANQAALEEAIGNFSAAGLTTSVGAIATSYMGATGLFTGLIVAILGEEIYCKLRKMDQLKIKMPDQVPPGVSRAFEVLIPATIVLLIMSTIGWLSTTLTGMPLNGLISKYVQTPLQAFMGNNIFAVMILYVIIMLFWCVGIHGNNMVAAVKEPLFTPLVIENATLKNNGTPQSQLPNVLNITMMQMFAEWGGSGVTLSLCFALLIFGKRPENRSIAGLSIVPGLFNINETVTFGLPLVLNPILDIPFILAPVACILVGYILVTIGFCPKVYIQAPWTCPPVLMGFIATGGNIMGGISQLIVIALAFVIYLPFVFAYESYQNKQDAQG